VTRPEPLDDQYFTRDLLVLHEVARAFANDLRARPYARDVAAQLDMDEDTVMAIGGALRSAGFVDGVESDRPGLLMFTELTPAGRREVGLWPSVESLADRLQTALEAAVEKAPDEATKHLGRRALEAFGAAGRDFAVNVSAAIVSRQLGA
jgi:hypothetical protein